MSKIMAVMNRELRAYFYSPVGYIVIAVFLVLGGIFFGLMDFDANRPAEMRNVMFWLAGVLVFLSPVITMRLISEEMSRGTIESLMTAPVTDAQVILGKFFGAVAFFLILLAPTLSYAVVLAVFAEPDWGPVFAGYLGLVLIGVLFLSIGLLGSCCTRSQIVSAFVPFVFLGIMTFLCRFLTFHLDGLPRDLLRYVGFLTRYENFGKGVISLNDVVFFLSLTVLALFLSVKILESRKWRGIRG
jgi:ABC-2 type transport system permease protein